MVLLSFALAVAHVLATAADTRSPPEDPRAVVREATRAVESDQTAPLRARWQARLEAVPADRAALLGLATLARLTYDYPAAEALYRRLIGEASTRPDRFTPHALLGQAWGLEERGFSNGAEAQFEHARKAAQAMRDGAAEAEALIALSFVSGRMKGVTAALALLDRAQRLIPESALDLEAERLRHRAILLGAAGGADAMAVAEASIALAHRAGDLRVEAQALRAAAKVLNFRAQNDQAVAFYKRAEDLFRKARDRSWLAVTVTDRAGTQLEQGDLGEAMQALRVGLAEAEASHNLFAVAGAHNGFADIAMHVNDVESATVHLNRAVEMYESQGDPSSATIPRRYLASLALAAGKPAEARRQVLEVLAFYQMTNEAPDVFELQRMLAAIAMREGDWNAAARPLAEAESLARGVRMRLWIDQLALDKGLLALFRGDLEEAERSLGAYLRTAASQPVVRYGTRLRLAEIHARRGELERAEHEAIAAWDELDRWRASLSDRELRLLAFQTSPAELKTPLVGKSDQDASAARLLGMLAAAGRVDSAFELAERRRARELMDSLLQADALRSGGRSASPRAADAVTAAAVRDSLPDEHTALLEFVVGTGNDPVTLFVVQRAGVQVERLAVNDLSARVARFAALLEGGTDPSELAQALGQALLQPVLAHLGAEVVRLVVVPDGPLHRLPWDALRLAGGQRVVERFAVSVAPSAAVVAALWRRPRETGKSARPVRLLAFGDPAFAKAADQSVSVGEALEVYRSAFDAAGGLPPLPASAREVQLVARYAPEAEIRLREAASAAWLKRAQLDRFRILHFATHALVDEGTVARTVLALAPGEGESGFVSPGELAALRLDADLVVLSACRTARGVVVEGEGVQGLTAPLLQAGARSVVATSWRIGDRATVAFVESFYGALARGLAVSDALRTVKLESIERGASPREWAVFTAVGDPMVQIPLVLPRRNLRWLSLLAIFSVLAAAAGYFVWTRRLRSGEARSSPEPPPARTHQR
jgi:CHAT domain-containing protein/tetratricopeptide (TPR) repeat protein